MKKLLVLMLVLGVASLASAGLKISVAGDLDPEETEYTVLVSTSIELDIHADGMILPLGQHNWALVVDSSTGSISGGTAVYQFTDVVNDVGGPCGENADVQPDPPQDGIWGAIANLNSAHVIMGDTELVNSIVFHCEGPDDAVVTLYDIQSGVPFGDISGGVILDQIVIHQEIPEPMTMALLGLGGLFLRRRK